MNGFYSYWLWHRIIILDQKAIVVRTVLKRIADLNFVNVCE